MRPVYLSPSQQTILNQIKRLVYATERQLEYWSGYTQSTVSKALSSLRAERLIQAEKGVLPNVWILTRSGSRALDVPLPSGFRKSSWSVMAHTCHRNQCEILLRESHSDFRFLEKSSLYRLGLNPSHGEHAGMQDGKIVFVLLDDYLMGSDRISTTLSRGHKKNEKYCDLKGAVNWRMVSHRFLVATTNKAQLEKHGRWINRRGLEAELFYLPPLWAF